VKLVNLIDSAHCLSPEIIETNSDLEVTGVTSNSRDVQAGVIFFAVLGDNFDGKVFIEEAFEKGALAVVHSGELLKPVDGITIKVDDVRLAIAYAATNFYSHPSQKLKNIAITGTSGKTSTAWILSLALQRLEHSTFLGGTLGYQHLIPGEDSTSEMKELKNTTIEAVSVNSYLAEAVEQGAQCSVFEVTSQGLVHNRMRYLDWTGAIFTNISRDHLDLHGTMENYIAAKKVLFTRDLVESKQAQKFAIFNFDDEHVRSVAYEVKVKQPGIKSLSVSDNLELECDYTIKDLQADTKGIRFNLVGPDCEVVLQSPMVGRHNAYNISYAAISLLQLGFSAAQISEVIAALPIPPGRLESLVNDRCSIFVDYAHKPGALENVLTFMKPLCKGRLICVVGCGGDRDKGKRPLMGHISSELADVSVITSDNPRTEDPQAIVDEVVAGVEVNRRESLVVEVDREAAIFKAIEMAGPDDAIVIAGKGHEPYQEVHGVKHPFDDLLVAKEVLAKLG
jgi:UDP-N-acetylmuramoyl-L-alanyl-D-glutamate--2,6-diaminopimelate ligase